MTTLHRSVLRLNPTHPAVRAEVRDTHAMHQRVEDATSGSPPGRVLWALPRPDVLIVQAPRPIVEACLPPMYTLTINVSPVVAEWPVGQTVGWALIGNPTQTRRGPEIADGRHARGIVGALPAAGWPAWFTARLSTALDLNEVRVIDLGVRNGRRKQRVVSHRQVAAAGAGAVADPERLAALITGGVGRGKAYGCGLLLVGAR